MKRSRPPHWGWHVDKGQLVQFDLGGHRMGGEVIHDNGITVVVRLLTRPLHTWRGHHGGIKRHKIKHNVRLIEGRQLPAERGQYER